METAVEENSKVAILSDKIENVLGQLDKTGGKLPPHSTDQDKILQFGRELIRTEEGMRKVYELMPRLVEAGIFTGGGWEREDKLLPSLIRGSFLAKGIYPIIETLSELRMVSIAEGNLKSENLSAEEAHEFLIEALALNLDFIYGTDTEESRNFTKQFEMAKRLFNFIANTIDIADLFSEFISEIKELSQQRPIVTHHIANLIDAGKGLVEKHEALQHGSDYTTYQTFYEALNQPTPLSKKVSTPLEYRKALWDLDDNELEEEAHKLGQRILMTGIAGAHASILIRFLAKKKPSLVPLCLNLNDTGFVQYEKHEDFVLKLIRMCIRPSTSQCIYGLGRFLERSLLSQRQVYQGIKKLVEVDIIPSVQSFLLQKRHPEDSITPNALLVSGLMAVLGQPLGVGQGNNPTCQAARGISLWSQHNPGLLIDTVIHAVRNGVVEISFEGQLLKSNLLLPAGYFSEDTPQDPNLDILSLVLNPHLDSLYNELMRRVAGRGEDGHKWVNPAFYGQWVPFGFDSVLDYTQTVVKNFSNFIRRFYATHHPEFCDDHIITYANPVGIFVTNSHGDLIGLHAVSIQRVRKDESGEVRVYFFNPNNEGRQNWGQGIYPTVSGHEERHGESSLPFKHFAARLYAFHFNPYEEGDGFAVPHNEVKEVVDLAKESWGKNYQWMA